MTYSGGADPVPSTSTGRMTKVLAAVGRRSIVIVAVAGHSNTVVGVEQVKLELNVGRATSS